MSFKKLVPVIVCKFSFYYTYYYKCSNFRHFVKKKKKKLRYL